MTLTKDSGGMVKGKVTPLITVERTPGDISELGIISVTTAGRLPMLLSFITCDELEPPGNIIKGTGRGSDVIIT